MKRVQVEPHLSVTGACSAGVGADQAEDRCRVPVRADPRAAARGAAQPPGRGIPYRHTSSPYLVGANGYYLRDPGNGQPIIAASLEASETHALEIGPDGDVLAEGRLEGESAFAKLVAHMKPYSPEWAHAICDVPAATIRRIAREYLAAAQVGSFIEIENKQLPYRPVAVSLGKTVTNGWGGYECCWARTLLASLVARSKSRAASSAPRCA